MNKKVSTLLTVAITLGGSLLSSTAFAGDVTPKTFRSALLKSGENAIILDVSKLGLPEGDTEIALTGNVDLRDLITTDKYQEGSEDTRNYATPLVIVKDPVTITSAGDKKTFIGRIVAATDGITIKNLIMKTSEASVTGVGPWFSSLISVFADKVEISGNKFEGLERTGGFNEAIVIYPQSNDVNYKIEGNEFLNFTTTRSDSRANGAIKINREGKALNSYGYQGYESFKKIYDAIKSLNKKGISDGKDDNKGEYSASPSIDVNALVSENTFGDVNDSNILLFDGEEVSYAVFDDIKDESEGTFAVITSKASDNAVIVLKNTTLTEAQEYLSNHKDDLAGKNLTYVLEKEKVNLPVGEVEELGNGYQNATLGGYISTQWGSYTPSTGTTNKVVLIYDGQAVKATKDAQGNVTYSLGWYDKDSYSEDNTASQYFFTLTPYELSAGKYELRLKDNYGNYFKVKDQYVTVRNVQVKVEEGKELYSSDEKQTWVEYNGENVVFPSELVLTAGGNNKYVKYDENTGFGVQNNYYLAQAFGISDIQIANVYASTLLKRYGEYFTIDITYKKDEVGQTDLTSIFEGNLCPMERVEYTSGEATYIKANPWATSFMLVNEKGEILAVNKNEDDRLSEGSNNHVYPLTTITPHDYVVDQAGDKNYVTTFYFEYTPGKDVSEVTEITNIYAWDAVDSKALEIGCYLDKKVPTLVAKDGAGLLDVTIELNKGTLVVAKEWLNQPAYYTVEVLNKAKYAKHKDQVLGLNENGAIDYVAATKTDINRPEGQFAISYNEDTERYDFTNRETGETTPWLDSDKLYKISSTEFAYLDGNHMDTLAIKPVTTYKSYDGFRRYSAADLNNNTYNIAMNLLDESFLYVVENHNDKHRIGLDREEATEWRIEIPTVKLLDAAGAQKALVADTVKVPATIKYWKDNTWVYTDDKVSKNVDGSYKYYDPNTVLEICTYILKDTDTDEYMMGSSDAEEEANAYYCPSETQATRIALKLVGDSTVNLVPVHSNYWYDETDNYGNLWTISFYNWNKDRALYESQYIEYNNKLSLSGNKIIGGTTSATGVLKDVDLYEATSNDLFVITEAAAPTYKKMEQGQKIVISRVENNDEVIYEKGEFAGIDNIKAYTDINPTLYVDTAYVNHDGNYRYEYLLGVNINRVDTIDDCGNPNHEHPRTVFTEGRFLVNMRDSADANTNVHNNKFEYDYESKLAFVSGYHQNDTLYITDEAGKVIAKSEVGNAAPHFAKFAFKMIDETNNEFVIEVGESAAKQSIYKNGMWQTVVNTEEASRGYLRWHNGNLVVTPYLDQAEHFTMETSDKEATANEAISAGNVVVAGTNGAVVVKGAEGKNVIVSTILGKVVANEVVSSDNAQIATPAGIVVVSVDGESFKVVVK